MGNIRIIDVPFGIGCRVNDKIYLNRNLMKKDVVLYLEILDHEMKHSSGFLWKDIILDLKNENLRGLKWRYYKFILTNPSSWTEFLPFFVYEGRIAINPLISMLYGIFLIIIGSILLLI